MRYLIPILFCGILLTSCDTITTDKSQGQLYTEDLDLLFADVHGKVVPENVVARRNAYCSDNPNERKCVKWCDDPQSDCEGGDPDPDPDPCDVNPDLPECDPDPDPCEDDCDPGPVGPDDIPSDRRDLGGSGWNNDLPEVPRGVIVFTGYSNASQHANTFINSYADEYDNYTFINCGLGSNALENWVTKNLASGCASNVRGDVVLTVNMIASQFAMTDAESSETIASMLPQLDAQLRTQFPNAIHAYYGGEPAHFVEPSKCPRICEPIRKLASDWASAAARAIGAYLGPYIWAGDNPALANASGVYYEITDFLNPTPDGYANQHPSNAGRAKVAAQYDRWFRANGID